MAGDAAICGITLQLLDPQTNVWTLGQLTINLI